MYRGLAGNIIFYFFYFPVLLYLVGYRERVKKYKGTPLLFGSREQCSAGLDTLLASFVCVDQRRSITNIDILSGLACAMMDLVSLSVSIPLSSVCVCWPFWLDDDDDD